MNGSSGLLVFAIKQLVHGAYAVLGLNLLSKSLPRCMSCVLINFVPSSYLSWSGNPNFINQCSNNAFIKKCAFSFYHQHNSYIVQKYVKLYMKGMVAGR